LVIGAAIDDATYRDGLLTSAPEHD